MWARVKELPERKCSLMWETKTDVIHKGMAKLITDILNTHHPSVCISSVTPSNQQLNHRKIRYKYPIAHPRDVYLQCTLSKIHTVTEAIQLPKVITH